MTLDIRINNQSLRDLITEPPVIYDATNAACRTLNLTVQNVKGLSNALGQTIELWYDGKRWFYGKLRRRRFTDTGDINYTAFDPLFLLNKNPNDYYFKNQTATQAMKVMAKKLGIKIHSLANTKAVFKALYYRGKEPDNIMVDLLARTYEANKKKFWYRFNPGTEDLGLILFERKVPSKMWAFEVGINLTGADLHESIENISTAVKLVNRETGKTVYTKDFSAIEKYGHTQHFEEVDKEKAKIMEKLAKEKLNKLSKVETNMTVSGVNPYRKMPQIYSGDYVYVEEPATKIISAYNVLNVEQIFRSDDQVDLRLDVAKNPEIPEIKYEDATKKPK